ncbi:uncharacterized protein [Halyomorpha halys]|uniref:uncharacterized protein n=1 Tax=Halyomorpha halys TaxID=286706 RepID=UPI0006D4CC4E|nr:uncharacterized protein LOC106690709 [Halyomorpha halys]
MVKTIVLPLVIAIVVISCGAFPTSEEHPRQAEDQVQNPADAYSTSLIDPLDYNSMKREVTADGKLNLSIATKENTPQDLSPPTKEGAPDDFAPPTIEGKAEGSLTDEELSELARCGYGGFGGGFNRPIIIPVPINQPSFIDVNLASRINSLNNNNNRPAIDWLTLLRLFG